MAIKGFKSLFSGDDPQREALQGTYYGGHPLHPVEVKRAMLNLSLDGISVSNNPVFGSPQELFMVPFGDIRRVNSDDHSFTHGEKYVPQYLVAVAFISEHGDEHNFSFLAGDPKGVRQFLNKFSANVYLHNEQTRQMPQPQAAVATPLDPEPRQPREYAPPGDAMLEEEEPLEEEPRPAVLIHEEKAPPGPRRPREL